jgi:phosphoribosylamine-glycine ligase
MTKTADSLAGKRLLILDGTRLAVEIVEHAKALGVHTIVADYYPAEHSPAKLAADEHHLVSITDVQAVVELIKAERIDGVAGGFSDRMLPYYAKICELASMPCYGSEELFRLFTDKRAYKELCRNHGVPVIEGYSVDQARNNSIPREGFPLLIKPADGSGSRGISVCRTATDLPKALNRAEEASPSKNLVVERYVDGKEATVFWVFQDGEHYVSMIANRHLTHIQDGVLPLPVGYTTPAALTPKYMQEIAPRVRSMLRAAGVKNGMMFMQGLIDDGTFRVYDIGYRVTGSQEYRLLEHLRDYNPLSMLVTFALTGSMGEPLLSQKATPFFDRYGFNMSTLMFPGTIDRFEGIQETAALPGVISVVKARIEGEGLPHEALGELRQITVRTLGCAESVEELRRAIDTIGSQIRILDSSNQDLSISHTAPMTTSDELLPL